MLSAKEDKDLPWIVYYMEFKLCFDDLRTLAQTADELWQVREQPVVVFYSDIRRPRNTRTTPVATPRTNEPVAHDEDVCYYHRRYGNAARKCNTPCAFAGNDRAGRH